MAILNESFPALFSPIHIGNMRLRNRLVMSPMENQYGSADGAPTQRSIDYFEARAKGGVGLITLGASAIDAHHKEVPSSLHFASDDVIAAHRSLTDAVHEHGAKIQPQLAHAGPDGLGPEMHGIEALGPSAIQSYLTQTTSRAMSLEDFSQVVDLYRGAARRAREAGYDGIELHAAHGYMLLGAFMTPWRNARRDQYSGRKPDGRVQAVIDVLSAIKSEVGADFPITLRISGYERIAGGRDSFDTQRIAPKLVQAGVDAFHVSGGVIDRYVTQMVNGSHHPDALNVAAAAAVKRVVDVPVMTVGRIHDPLLAEQILAEGDADLIVMGRPMIADPEIPAKARTGRSREIRRCISCENCIDAMEQRFAMDCAVNPQAGREAELRIERTSTPKKILIVGGGPAGLEAARVATLRGHHVTLCERNRHLGGALVMASTVHHENQPFLDYLLREVRRLGIEIEIGRELDAQAITARRPDAVIIATGGRIVAAKIPGDDLSHVVTGAMMREILAGRPGPESLGRLSATHRAGARLLDSPIQRWISPALLRAATRVWMPLGRRVAIVGADLAAVELAEFLAERGRRVCVLESAEVIMPEVGPKRHQEHMIRLDRARVSLNTGVAIDRITSEGVVLRLESGSERLVPADSVILAGEAQPDTRLHESIQGLVPEVHAIGDCTGLGLIQKATLDGARAASRIG